MFCGKFLNSSDDKVYDTLQLKDGKKENCFCVLLYLAEQKKENAQFKIKKKICSECSTEETMKSKDICLIKIRF